MNAIILKKLQLFCKLVLSWKLWSTNVPAAEPSVDIELKPERSYSKLEIVYIFGECYTVRHVERACEDLKYLIENNCQQHLDFIDLVAGKRIEFLYKIYIGKWK